MWRRYRSSTWPFLAGLFFTTLAVLANAEHKVKEANPTCANAHAVLVASKSTEHDYIWGEIGKVVRAGKGKYIVVDDYEPGVVQKVSFRQWELKYNEGGYAYVAHCGHGGTCNDLAKEFLAKHPDWYSPEVFCGLVPGSLVNPKKVSF
jgi:hypothetical protein